MNLPRLPRRPRRRHLAGCALLLLVPALGACGFDAQTDQVYQAANGTNSRIDFVNSRDHVDILNSVVVSKKDGSGVWAGSLVNLSQSEPDQLVSVSSGTLGQGPVRVPPGELVNFGRTGELVIEDPQVQPGHYVQLTFTFSSGQITKLATPVMPYSPTGIYSAVPMPTPSATTGTGSAEAGGAGSSPSGSPSDEDTGAPSSSSSS